ncbi:MAG: PDZ domain-containing protein, partial [Myxococcota bacterium]
MMKSRVLWWGLLPAAGLVMTWAAMAAPRGDEVAAVTSRESTGPAALTTLAPPNHEREVARLVAEHLERFHYTDRPIDDALSQAWFDGYLDRLDYQRTIFLAEDIESFAAYRTTFDDIVQQRRPDLTAPVRMYTVNRERLRERIEFVQQLLDKGIDVTNEESFVPDRHEADAPWPKTAAEANELWRQRIENEYIDDRLDGDTDAEIIERLQKRYANWVKILDDEESTDLVESWLSSLTRTYDPHSEWFKPAKNDDFDIDITNSVTGIGASLRTEGDDTLIVELIPGGPAEKDGRLRPKDVIVAVAQGRKAFVDVVGWRIDKVVKLIRGEVGSKVRLLVEHPAGGREEIDIVRDRVTLEDSDAEHSIEEVRGRKIGVVRLPSFYVDPTGRQNGKRASQDVKAALSELNAQGAEGLVLD